MKSSKEILCVDDNRFVLDALTSSLEQAGYHVLAAPNAVEALAVFRRASEAIGLVVTDIDMPQMSGVELAGLVRESKENCRVLLISGNAMPPEARGLKCSFLAKPFAPDVLLETVEEMLAGNRQ